MGRYIDDKYYGIYQVWVLSQKRSYIHKLLKEEILEMLNNDDTPLINKGPSFVNKGSSVREFNETWKGIDMMWLLGDADDMLSDDDTVIVYGEDKKQNHNFEE